MKTRTNRNILENRLKNLCKLRKLNYRSLLDKVYNEASETYKRELKHGSEYYICMFIEKKIFDLV